MGDVANEAMKVLEMGLEMGVTKGMATPMGAPKNTETLAT